MNTYFLLHLILDKHLSHAFPSKNISIKSKF